VEYAGEEPEERRGLYCVECAVGAMQQVAPALVEEDSGVAAEGAFRRLAGRVPLRADA
jgi:hypothetical protein